MGMKTAAARVSRGWIVAIKYRDIKTRIKTLSSEVSCSETNILIVSTSDVQRWIVSPVLFSPCQA